MGAFFLFKHAAVLNLEAAKKHFVRLGLGAMREFDLGEYGLLLYRKKLVAADNCRLVAPGEGIFCVGTMLYRGAGPSDSLPMLLDDFRRRAWDPNEIIGSYCVLIALGGKIHLLVDRSNLQNVFVNAQGTVVSSSFLATLVSHREPVRLNRLAVSECLATGILIGPETMVEGIRRIDNTCLEQLAPADIVAVRQAVCVEPGHRAGSFEQSVEEQLETLRDYMSRMRPLAESTGIDIGLSGGYDSRLLLALALGLHVDLAAHTHYKKHWDLDSRIAAELAEKAAIELIRPPVVEEADLSEGQLLDNLERSLLFYDGQCRVNFPLTSSYRPAEYREGILHHRRLGLNGVGGEQYRNAYHLHRPSVAMRTWIGRYVCDRSGWCAIRGHPEGEAVVEYTAKKLAERLNLGKACRLRRADMMRYYSEIWAPFGPGVRNSAENQLSYFLSPFAETRVSHKAYDINGWLGTAGRFEAAMICRLNRVLAEVPSSYGFPFTREPWRHRMVSYMRGWAPPWTISAIGQMQGKYRKAFRQVTNLGRRHPCLQEALSRVRDVRLPLNIDFFGHEWHAYARVLGLGFFLGKFGHVIKS